MTPTAQLLVEALDLSQARIQPEARTVRQVLIKAGLSANRRHYSAEVLRRAAPLFEGARTFTNHPSRAEERDRPERSIRDVSGWLSAVAFENDALAATRHFTRNQAGQDAWALIADIVEGRAPAALIGASINAVGRARSSVLDGGEALIVESIDAVHSVDDVVTAAAGGGFVPLLMSAPDDLRRALLNALSFEEWRSVRPEFASRLREEIENDSAAQALRAQIEAERDAALARAEAAQRELDLERLLARADLPEPWLPLLREQLALAPRGDWEPVLERERAKARSAGPRVPVHSAPQQIHQPYAPPRPARRAVDLRALRAPEDLAALVREIQAGLS